MKRRTFVQNVLAASVFSGIPGSFRLSPNPPEAILYMPEIMHLFDDPTEVIEIGKSYLSLNPAHADELVLIEQIKGRFNYQPSSIEANLAKQVIKDFADGDTIRLNGWILSQTEAQQCALYSLTYS